MAGPPDELKIIVYALMGLYGLLILVPVIQLIRIRIRTPDIGWTTQKIFLLLIGLSAAVRTAFFVIVPYFNDNFFMLRFGRTWLFAVLDSSPNILYFSTYSLLILFWGEIIHQARNEPVRLRPIFIMINFTVYAILVGWWLALIFVPSQRYYIDLGGNAFTAAIYVGASIGFIVYGGRLFIMLRRFPIDSAGRRSKLREVGYVTVTCVTFFTCRAVLLAYACYNQGVDFENIFVGCYFFVVEVVPSFLVLFTLRKLPLPRHPRSSGTGFSARSSIDRPTATYSYQRLTSPTGDLLPTVASPSIPPPSPTTVN
eukprot:TRINITY_DN27024_c0_g1_i1.p1 TRINITY_DN27024_c0_g1~~TRINITY_DN27024_c0_g1_i1.p1  ORF type:complete len:312 (+),score=44.48 TRINITY_DN27024_c0_g1_i1:75-1010(+)